MQSLIILGIIFLITLSSIVFLVFIVWQRLNLYVSFGINPEKHLAYIIRCFEAIRVKCISIQKDDWELLSYKSEPTKLKETVKGFRSGYIQNIYAENIFAYGFYPSSSKNPIIILGTKEQFCLFRKNKDGRFSVYWNNSTIYAYINSKFELTRNNSVIGRLVEHQDKGFTSLFLDDLEYATINEWRETESKIPQRFFNIIKDIPSTSTNDFRILCYFKMYMWLTR
ncbi:MAG TPA: hypothetical protein VK590_05890 [Saprospiraceae bacterium]|nr:hypothetical protein [Saprospiraceae bacterium]